MLFAEDLLGDLHFKQRKRRILLPDASSQGVKFLGVHRALESSVVPSDGAKPVPGCAHTVAMSNLKMPSVRLARKRFRDCCTCVLPKDVLFERFYTSSRACNFHPERRAPKLSPSMTPGGI